MTTTSPSASNPAPTIVIVGGVAGGASAATRARRMNEHATIILFEKDEHVSFANCGLPYHIGGEIVDRAKLLVATPKLLRDRFRIDARTRHEVTALDRARKVVAVRNRETGETFEQPYDKLILAPGAAPIIPPVAGIDARNVFTLRNLADTDRIKGFVDAAVARGSARPAKAVVIGAGFIGLEMVEALDGRGMHVALVELAPQVLPPLDADMARLVEAELRRHHVDLHLGNGLKAFETTTRDGQSVATHVVLNDGTKLDADLVIVGVGVRPNVALAKDNGLALGDTGGIRVDDNLRTSDGDIYAVGDAAEYTHGVADLLMRVPLAGPANRAGRLAGQHAATGSAPKMAPVMGTAIVRVFDLVAAVTGAGSRLLDRLKTPYRFLHVRANHHAGYFPGAQPMTLKLIYQPDTRRVLGAQAVGQAGVDKRIDVIATALRFGATVDDLTELDLAYAPPFGSAKDPVHMLGFAAVNDLDGVVHFLAPDADLAGRQVVDLRSDAEVSQQPLPAADGAAVHHIPVDALRARLGELDPAKPTTTVCASGVRAYAGARILSQHGFTDVTDLSGGVILRTQLRGNGVAVGA